MVLVLAVSGDVGHARYTGVEAARETRLIVAHGDLAARPPAASWRFPADSGHAR